MFAVPWWCCLQEEGGDDSAADDLTLAPSAFNLGGAHDALAYPRASAVKALFRRLRAWDKSLVVCAPQDDLDPRPPADAAQVHALQLGNLHRTGLLWCRLFPSPEMRDRRAIVPRGYLVNWRLPDTPRKDGNLRLAPEELLGLPITRRTDIWILAWGQRWQADGPDSTDPAFELRATLYAYPDVRSMWEALASRFRVDLDAICDYTWHVMCVLGGPPDVKTWPYRLHVSYGIVGALNYAWNLVGNQRKQLFADVRLHWDPLKRAGPLEHLYSSQDGARWVPVREEGIIPTRARDVEPCVYAMPVDLIAPAACVLLDATPRPGGGTMCEACGQQACSDAMCAVWLEAATKAKALLL